MNRKTRRDQQYGADRLRLGHAMRAAADVEAYDLVVELRDEQAPGWDVCPVCVTNLTKNFAHVQFGTGSMWICEPCALAEGALRAIQGGPPPTWERTDLPPSRETLYVANPLFSFIPPSARRVRRFSSVLTVSLLPPRKPK